MNFLEQIFKIFGITDGKVKVALLILFLASGYLLAYIMWSDRQAAFVEKRQLRVRIDSLNMSEK